MADVRDAPESLGGMHGAFYPQAGLTGSTGRCRCATSGALRLPSSRVEFEASAYGWAMLQLAELMGPPLTQPAHDPKVLESRDVLGFCEPDSPASASRPQLEPYSFYEPQLTTAQWDPADLFGVDSGAIQFKILREMGSGRPGAKVRGDNTLDPLVSADGAASESSVWDSSILEASSMTLFQEAQRKHLRRLKEELLLRQAPQNDEPRWRSRMPVCGP